MPPAQRLELLGQLHALIAQVDRGTPAIPQPVALDQDELP